LLHVVLVAPRNPLNIGAVARAMSNFGFKSLRLVVSYRDPVAEARSGPHAGPVLDACREYSTLAEAVADCELVYGTGSMEKRAYSQELDPPAEAARRIQACAGDVALVFGSERHGLTAEEFSYCHRLIRIPTRPEHGSMNLGQAAAICLYELVREEKEAQYESEETRAPAGDVDRLSTLLLDALDASGYNLGPSHERRVRQMVRRMDLRPHDAHVWLGMIRQMLWKIRSG
jgi:tRNA/rRNA methyltransferase